MATVKFDITIKDLEWVDNCSYVTDREVYNKFLFCSGQVYISQVRVKGQAMFWQVVLDCLGIADCEYCYSWKEVFNQLREGYDLR